jgi:signal transduction histidine kinase
MVVRAHRSAGRSGSRLRVPRQTVRLRLTMLYSGLFLTSGAVLLAIAYVIVDHAIPLSVDCAHQFCVVGPSGGTAAGQHVLSGKGLTAGQLRQQASQLRAQGVKQHADDLRHLLAGSGIALAVMGVMSIMLGWIVAGRVLRPLRTIAATAKAISASNLNERLALDGPHDELRELGDTFDELLGRLEASFTAQRQFVANASHELRSPLARQRTLVQVALADPEATVESLRATHERVLASGAQQERIIEALLTLSRGQAGLSRHDPIDLAIVTGQVLPTRYDEAARRNIVVRTALAPASATGDPRLAERLVANLVDNAVGHNIPHGQVEITTGEKDDCAVIVVSNTGPLVPDTEMDRLFRPFQRLDGDRVGHRTGVGLGLSIVQAIAHAHGAVLVAAPRPTGGMRVEVTFPRTPSQLRHDNTEHSARRSLAWAAPTSDGIQHLSGRHLRRRPA